MFASANGKYGILSYPQNELYRLDNICPGQTKNLNVELLPVIVDNSLGTLNIRTTGWESDSIDDLFGCNIPGFQPWDIFDTLTTKTCISTDFLDDNDKICQHRKEHTSADNFGVGKAQISRGSGWSRRGRIRGRY